MKMVTYTAVDVVENRNEGAGDTKKIRKTCMGTRKNNGKKQVIEMNYLRKVKSFLQNLHGRRTI